MTESTNTTVNAAAIVAALSTITIISAQRWPSRLGKGNWATLTYDGAAESAFDGYATNQDLVKHLISVAKETKTLIELKAVDTEGKELEGSLWSCDDIKPEIYMLLKDVVKIKSVSFSTTELHKGVATAETPVSSKRVLAF